MIFGSFGPKIEEKEEFFVSEPPKSARILHFSFDDLGHEINFWKRISLLIHIL